MSSIYQHRPIYPTSPELRKPMAPVPHQDQDRYKTLEESVRIQQGEIMRLRRDIGRLRNQLSEMTNRIKFNG